MGFARFPAEGPFSPCTLFRSLVGVTKPKPKDEDASALRPNNSHPRKVEASKAARGPKHFETLAKISLKTDKLLITLPKTASKRSSMLNQVRFRDEFLITGRIVFGRRGFAKQKP